MLVLLVIFMITAPLITTGIINLPEVSKVTQKKKYNLVKILKMNLLVLEKEKGASEELVTFSELPTAVKNLIKDDENTAVVISADKKVTYELVAKAIDNLNKGGVSRVGLLVRQK